ncbi:GGDEF domain-containing protein [Roseibium salinum]|nr:GGDEF domain-containing protein [Roseibium salinum]
MLLLSIFAICFLAVSLQASPRGHWLSWSAANALLAAALLGFALDRHAPSLAAYLLPNALLLLGFGFHWHAARQLAQLPTGIVIVAAPAAGYLIVAGNAYLFSNFALAYTASNAILTFVAVATISAYASKPFQGLISAIGLVLAFFFLGVDGALRTVHGLVLGGLSGPLVIDDTLQNAHLMFALVFVSLTGAFSLAISFEQVAQRNQEAARRDPLTGTFNRREFQDRLEEILRAEPAQPFGLLHFDLDHFKQVNDRFGHVAGDAALVKICDTVKNHLRQDDCLARLGGEEFAVLLPRISRENAFKVAERVRERISELRYDFAPQEFSITASSGIYHGTGDGLGYEELFQIVDQGLYQSKSAGRNRISIAVAGEELALVRQPA